MKRITVILAILISVCAVSCGQSTDTTSETATTAPAADMPTVPAATPASADTNTMDNQPGATTQPFRQDNVPNSK